MLPFISTGTSEVVFSVLTQELDTLAVVILGTL
jgi:hypothetical protein